MNPGIEIWDLNLEEPVEPVLTLKGHEQSTTALQLHPQRINLLVSSSDDKSLILWDLEKVKELGKWKQKSETLNMKWAVDNESVLFTMNAKKQLKMFDVRTGKDQLLKTQLSVENFV